MSSTNVELVRRLYDAFKARENSWPFEVYDRDIEWDLKGWPQMVDLGIEPIYHGHDGVRAFWRQWLEAWESIEFRLDDLIDAGDDVVALISQVSRGRVSGAEVPTSYAMVWTVRDGMVVRMRNFGDRAEALRAAGLDD
jgi:ketosteroid isomerase-like protein